MVDTSFKSPFKMQLYLMSWPVGVQLSSTLSYLYEILFCSFIKQFVMELQDKVGSSQVCAPPRTTGCTYGTQFAITHDVTQT